MITSPDQIPTNNFTSPGLRSRVSKWPIIRPLLLWLVPRSSNRDEAFRERTIRITVAIMITALALALIASRVVFAYPWTLVSYSTVISVLLVLSLASALAIAQKQLVLSGWLLTLALIAGGVGIALVDGYWAFLVVPIFLLAVLVCSLVLPRNVLLWVAASCIIILGLTGYFQTVYGFVPEFEFTWTAVFVNGFFVLLPEALFLSQLRGEFDARLNFLRESIVVAEEARKEADRANEAKSQFLANMSHELRTPLNAIIGYVEIMLGGMVGGFTEKQEQIHNYIHQNAKRLLGLINDILDLAKIEAGRVDIRVEAMSPKKVIDETVAGMYSLAQQKGIKLEATYTPNMPDTVLCDSGKVQQIVINLVGNAIKFTEQGGVTVAVSVPDQKHWQIKVQDTGKGMPQEALDYIFEMFRQVDGTDTRQHKGTGLGLAITKRLIDHLQGTVNVTTELGKGSAFIVMLPLEINEEKQTPELQPEHA